MGNDLKIVLNGEDKGAASALEKLNTDIMKATKSLDVMGSGAEEIGKTKDNVEKVSKPINAIEKAAAGAGFAINKLQAFIGLAVGGVSLAGVVEMSRQWAEFGAEIRRTSDALGITADSLQALRGGAVMGGLSAESMTGALGSLGKNLQDAKWGRNKGLLSTMSLLNIQFKQTKSGAIDTVAMLDDMVDAFARFQDNPVLQRELFEQAGIGGIFNIANHGSSQMHEKEAEGQYYNPALTEDQIKKSAELAQATWELKGAFQGVENLLAADFSTAIKGATESLADFIARNRRNVADVAEIWPVIKRISQGTWEGAKSVIKQTVAEDESHKFFWQSQDAAPREDRSLSGDWEKFKSIFNIAPHPAFAAPTNSLGGPSGKNWEENTDYIKNKLMGMGYTEPQTYGIMANLQAESQGDVNALGDSGQAYGIAQWHPDRQQDFARVMGHDIHGSTLDEQLEFMDWELKNTRKKAGDDLSYAATPGSSASIFSQEFEAPFDPFGAKARGRAGAAEQMAAGAVHVQVSFVNAPPGTRAIAQASGNVTTETKIGYTGPGNLP